MADDDRAAGLPPQDPFYLMETPLSTDGTYWPVARQDMRSPRAIIERMALDIRHLCADGMEPSVSAADRRREGGSADQLTRHGNAAVRQVTLRQVTLRPDSALAPSRDAGADAYRGGRHDPDAPSCTDA